MLRWAHPSPAICDVDRRDAGVERRETLDALPDPRVGQTCCNVLQHGIGPISLEHRQPDGDGHRQRTDVRLVAVMGDAADVPESRSVAGALRIDVERSARRFLTEP
jgi:hypothetical protein